MSTFTAILLGALVVSLIGNAYLITKVNNINIKKQVQKNRHSPDNTQEYNASNGVEKKKLFNFKKRKNEKQ